MKTLNFLAAMALLAPVAPLFAQCPGGICPASPLGSVIYRSESGPSQVTARVSSPAATKLGEKIPATALELSAEDVVRKTLGDVSPEARKKYASFDAYVAARRSDAIAGKGFEAFFAIDYNAASHGTDTLLIPTAALGRPTDPADLALIDLATREVIALYQCKIGETAARRAASDPRYQSFTILTPADTFAAIEKSGRDTIKTGRLADTIDCFRAEPRAEYEKRALDYLRSRFESAD